MVLLRDILIGLMLRRSNNEMEARRMKKARMAKSLLSSINQRGFF